MLVGLITTLKLSAHGIKKLTKSLQKNKALSK